MGQVFGKKKKDLSSDPHHPCKKLGVGDLERRREPGGSLDSLLSPDAK